MAQEQAAVSIRVEEKTDDWQPEYEEFLSQTWEDRQHRKQRVANGASFLQKGRDAPLVKRLEFLRYKGLSEAEIEEAFEIAGQDQELIRLMEGSFLPSDYGPTAEELALAQANELTTPFRPEDRVWTYVATSGVYYAGWVIDIDESRGHDILRIRYADAAPAELAGHAEWREPGFKGVVADVPPRFDLLRAGMQVLHRRAAARDMEDALILRLDLEGEECDLLLNDSAKAEGVSLWDVRGTDHPDDEEALRRRKSQLRKWSAGINPGLMTSAYELPVQGVKERKMQARELVALTKGIADARSVSSLAEEAAKEAVEEDDGEEDAELTFAERYTLGVGLRSFIRYPSVDLADKPPRLRTFADVARAAAAELPTFELRAFARHPDCPHLMLYNPILEVVDQCNTQKTMFVDPDFPPIPHSLWGTRGRPRTPPPETGSTEPKAGGQFEWRRLSEIYARPRCFGTATNASAMQPGPFSAKWMCPVFAAALRGAELETALSPATEPSQCGCYTVRLLIDGRFWWVLVDDFVPVHKGSADPAYLRSGTELQAEIWATLLEKAYAKLQGSYQALRALSAYSADAAFGDLTGGLAERDEYALLTNKDAWVENLRGRLELQGLCTVLAAAPRHSGISSERKLQRLGVEAGGYHVVQQLHAAECGDADEGERDQHFVMSADPWSPLVCDEGAQQTVLRAARAPTLRTLQALAAKYRDDHGHSCTWLSFAEHMRLFEACVSLFSFKGWQRAVLMGSFEGRSGGSRFAHDNAAWAQNPQVHVKLETQGTLCAELCLADRRFRRARPRGTVLQMSLLKARGYAEMAQDPAGLLMTSNALILEEVPGHGGYAVYLMLSVEAGNYLLIPEIGDVESTDTFALKVWSSSNFTVHHLFID